MEIYLIRHAQSLNNARPVEERGADPPLTDLGRRQASRLAPWVKTLGFTRLICSPFRRTLETAEYIRSATNLTPEVRVEWHERGGCIAGTSVASHIGRPGMTRNEIKAEFPEFQLPDQIDGDGWWKSAPVESLEAAYARAEATVGRTRDEFANTDERVAFVTHGDFKTLMLACFFAEPLPMCDPFSVIHNTGMSKLVVTPNEITLEYLNQVNHLDLALVS